MDASQYYQQQIAPFGSTIYYSLITVEPQKRMAIILVHGIAHIISKIILKCQELEIAKMKLTWFREQIKKTTTHRAEHPLLQALQPYILQFNLPLAPWFELMGASETYLNNPVFVRSAEAYHYFCQTEGCCQQLINHILNQQTPIADIHPLAAGLANTDYISNLAYITRCGYSFFAEEDLNHYGLSLHDLTTLKMTDNIHQFLSHQIKKTTAQLAIKTPNIPKPLKIQALIAKATLNKIVKKNLPIFCQKISIAPMTKFYLAFRVNRNHHFGVTVR